MQQCTENVVDDQQFVDLDMPQLVKEKDHREAQRRVDPHHAPGEKEHRGASASDLARVCRGGEDDATRTSQRIRMFYATSHRWMMLKVQK